MSLGFYINKPRTREAEAYIEQIEVFPHGKCDIQGELERLTRAMDVKDRFIGTTLAGLRLYSTGPGRSGFVSENKTHPEILSSNPWYHTPRTPAAPGYYKGAAGTTHTWADCWLWIDNPLLDRNKQLFLDLQSGKRIKLNYAKIIDHAFLEISGVTWFYLEMGDYATSVYIDVINYERYNHEHQRVDIPFLEKHKNVAILLARQLREFLQAHPASKESVAKRLAYQEQVRQAQEAARQAQAAERQAEAERLNQQQLARQAAIEAQQRDRVAQAHRAIARKAASTVAILYDTSYLMTDRMFLHQIPLFQNCTVTNIVAEEVKAELQKHIEGAEEKQSTLARMGRGRVVSLREYGEQGIAYREVVLSASVKPQRYDLNLAPDSPTDSLIIEYGKYLLSQRLYAAVVIASNDGGIRYLVSDIRQKEQQPLYSVADPRDEKQVEPLSRFLSQISRESGFQF